jgi:ACS family glucarate transporter-like MFS transporter
MTIQLRRWKVAYFLGLATLLGYLDRVSISHALILIEQRLHLGPEQEGIILSAFSVGYVALMGIGGTLVDIYTPYVAMQIAIIVWSAATGATALCTGVASLFLVRFLVGAGEAPIFPAAASVVSSTFHASERGRATAIFDAGSYIGAALSAPVVIYLMLHWGWQLPFLICSGVGIVYLMIWREHMGSVLFKVEQHSAKWSFRLLRLAMTKPVLIGGVGFFCYNYGKSFFLTWLPLYLVRDRSMHVNMVGLAGALPAIAALIGEMLGGISVDILFRRFGSVAISRTVPVCIGLLLGSTLILAPLVKSNVLAIILLCIAFAGITSASPGIWTIPADIAPSSGLVGTVGGIQNTISNLAGFIAPLITGWALSKTGNFRLALAIAGGLCVCGAIAYSTIFMQISPRRTYNTAL